MNTPNIKGTEYKVEIIDSNGEETEKYFSNGFSARKYLWKIEERKTGWETVILWEARDNQGFYNKRIERHRKPTA
jgi:hypothetical protein